MINYEEQLEKLLTSYKLHDVLSAHLQQFKSVDDITRLPLDEVPSVEGVITKQENIDRHPPLERILLLGNEIEKERTKEQREKLVRERAEAVFKSGDKEKIQDIASIISGSKEAPMYLDKEAFINDCIEVNGTISYYILGILSKEAVDYLNRETSDISDEELLKMFDPTIENYNFFDSRRYNLIVSFYIARRTAGLKNGIVQIFKKSVLHDLRSKHSFGIEDLEKAHKVYQDYSVDDDTLTILAEAKLSDHISYNLFDDYEYKVKSILGNATKNILAINKTYPDSFLSSNSRFDRKLRYSASYNDFFSREGMKVAKSNNTKELDGVFNFYNYINNPNLSEEEGKERREKSLCDINALNEKYKSLDNKMNVFESVLNSIGSEMLACDNTLTREAVLGGRTTTLKPIYITPSSNYKYREADKGAKPTQITINDFETALELANETWVKITQIRGNKELEIESRLLEYEIVKVKIHGKETKAYAFTKLPAIYRYNLINNDMITRKMENDSDRKNLLKSSNYAKDIYEFLERWVDRYITEERNVIEYSYDKVIKEAGIKLDIDSSSPQARKNRQKLLKYVDRALEELLDKELIEDYTPMIETEESKRLAGRRKYYKFRIIGKNTQKQGLANNH